MQPNLYVSDLFTAAAATTVAAERDMSSFSHLTVFLTSTSTTSGGVVTLEEAPTSGYTGTWSTITTVNASSFTGGATVAIHFTPSSYRFVRVRISSTITGGGSIAATVIGR